MKNSNKNQGITLIALVITIIVMLILVAVTISLSINGGLFEYAKNSVQQTNEALEYEKTLGDVDPNLSTNQLIEKYVKKDTKKLIHFTISGDNVTAEEGMTFAEWIESEYNTTTVCIENNIVVPYPNYTRSARYTFSLNDVIQDGEEYSLHY